MSATTILHVVREIRRRTVTSQGRLAEATGYHPATISRMMKPLVAADFVQKLEKRGRDEPLRLHPGRGVLVGVDTTREKLQVAVTDLAYEGRVFESDEDGWPNRGAAREPPEKTLGVIAEVVRKALGEYGGPDDIVGVGLALPGPVGRGGISRSPLLLPTSATPWASSSAPQIDVSRVLTRELAERGIRFPGSSGRRVVAVEDVASLGALGVFTRARLDDFVSAADDVLYVRVTRMGIGAGIVLKGHLVTGASGFAGEIGHLRVRPGPDGVLCPRCGGRGCLETLSSERAVMEQLRGIVPSESAANLKKILDHDHPAVDEALWEAGWWVGVAVAHACMLLNPAQVVLGGAIAEDPRFRERAWHAIERNAMTEIRQAGMDRFMPTWKQLAQGKAAGCGDVLLTPELLGALGLVVDELGDDYLHECITSWYNAGGMGATRFRANLAEPGTTG